MINVNHKIKCTHEGTSILRYIKKDLQTANCMLIITFHRESREGVSCKYSLP